MLLTEQQLRKVIRRLLSELNWQNSRDIDYPAGGYASDNTKDFGEAEGLNFRPLRSSRMLYIKASGFDPIQDPFGEYILEGETHGLDSHALKHMLEFSPEQTLAAMQSLKQEIIDRSLEVYLYQGENQPPVQIAPQNITPGDLINTLDRINDSIINQEFVSFVESQMYKKYLVPLAQSYDAQGDYIVGTAADVSDASFQNVDDLVKFLLTSPIIKFNGVYKHGDGINTYYYDMTTTALVSEKGSNGKGTGPFATIYRITKKFREETPKQALRHFKPGKSTTPDAQTCSTFIKAIEVIQAS